MIVLFHCSALDRMKLGTSPTHNCMTYKLSSLDLTVECLHVYEEYQFHTWYRVRHPSVCDCKISVLLPLEKNINEYKRIHTHQTLGPVFINPVLTRTPPVEMETILVVHLARVVEAVDHLVTQGCASVASVDDALWNVKGEALAKPTSNKSSQDPHLIVLREVVCVVGKLSS